MLKKIIIAFALICCSHVMAVADEVGNKKHYEFFKNIFEIVEQHYVTEIDKQQMLDAAVRGMLESLDPYSTYLSGSDVEDFQEEASGEFGGVGIKIVYDKGLIKIITPIDDLPAYNAGIKSGDYIVSINDEAVNKGSFIDAVKKMRGEAGTQVKLTIVRINEQDPIEFNLKRSIVKLHPVKSNLDNEIAYVRIAVFNQHTAAELQKAINTLQKEAKSSIKGIVLDLRNNPGGILQQAIDVSGYFIDTGIVVTIKGRHKPVNNSFAANRFSAKAPKVPLVILINEGSASASEIVAGAVQDHKRGLILGTTSVGKGSVQSFIPIDKRSAIKFTEAKYYSPSGREIQDEGIVPDIYVKQTKIDYSEKQEESAKEKFIRSYFKMKKPKEHKEEDKKSDRYIQDYQYARAIDLIKGMNISNNTK